MTSNINYQENYNKLSGTRQMVLPLDYGLMISDDESVRLLDAVLVELDYTELQRLYSPKGRKSVVPPDIFFKVYCFAMLEGIYSTRAMKHQCQVNIQYMWLLRGYPVPSHMSFQRFFARIPTEVLKRLFAQFIERLSTKDSIDFGEVFIDATKLEADANRYTFVWKKRVNTELAKIPGKLDTIKADILAVTGEQVDADTDEVLLSFLRDKLVELDIALISGKGHRKTLKWTPLSRPFFANI